MGFGRERPVEKPLIHLDSFSNRVTDRTCLCSDEVNYVTGTVLAIDGGMSELA